MTRNQRARPLRPHPALLTIGLLGVAVVASICVGVVPAAFVVSVGMSIDGDLWQTPAEAFDTLLSERPTIGVATTD